MDRLKITIFVGIDFSRDFDLLRHDLLLAIMKSIGLFQEMLTWFTSYLANRVQSTKSPDGLLSSWRDVVIGTLQGSVLSGLIFSIFMNSILEVFQYCMYADHLQLHLSCNIDELDESMNRLVKDDLQRLDKWHVMSCEPKNGPWHVIKCEKEPSHVNR